MLKAEDKPKKTDKEKELLKKQKEKEKKEREKAKKEKERLKKQKEKEKKEREKAKKEKERLKKEKEKAKLAKQKEKESKKTSAAESKKTSAAESKKTSTKKSVESKKISTIDSKNIQGELIGKVYDPHDSPMASVYLTKNGFAFSCNTTGQAVESKNLWNLVEKDYLSVTDGKKWLNIRWARNKKFDIHTHTHPWRDKKPHWSKSEESVA